MSAQIGKTALRQKSAVFFFVHCNEIQLGTENSTLLPVPEIHRLHKSSSALSIEVDNGVCQVIRDVTESESEEQPLCLSAFRGGYEIRFFYCPCFFPEVEKKVQAPVSIGKK